MVGGGGVLRIMLNISLETIAVYKNKILRIIIM